MSIQKAHGTKTLALTRAIDAALDEAEATLPKGINVNRHVMRQSDFIETSLEGSMHLLTVFPPRERGAYRAVYSRHKFYVLGTEGDISASQNYGSCQVWD